MTDILTRAKGALEGTTEGPWEVEGLLVYALQSDGYRGGQERFRNRFSARFDFCPHSKNEAEAKANADFFVAAPDLVRDLMAEVERMREALTEIDDKVSWEINPSNYDHDDVCNMNTDWCEVGNIARAALEGDKQ